MHPRVDNSCAAIRDLGCMASRTAAACHHVPAWSPGRLLQHFAAMLLTDASLCTRAQGVALLSSSQPADPSGLVMGTLQVRTAQPSSTDRKDMLSGAWVFGGVGLGWETVLSSWQAVPSSLLTLLPIMSKLVHDAALKPLCPARAVQ